MAVVVWTAISETPIVPQVLAALVIGVANDLLMGVALFAPFVFGFFLFPSLWRRRALAVVVHALLIMWLGVFVFTEVSEIFFWNEFNSRFNSIAVNYLIFPREVIGNIRESFNLMYYLPPVGLAALALYLFLRRPLMRMLEMPIAPRPRKQIMGGAVAAFVLAVGGLYVFPEDLFDSRLTNEAAKSGLHSLFRAALTNDQRYDGFYLGMDDAEALALVRAMVAQDNTTFLPSPRKMSLLRRVDNGAVPKKLNIVLVFEESFGSVYVDGLDGPAQESISPNLLRLAQDGLLFTNIYATGNRTVRGLEALLTSFPPIPGVSTTRRPGSEGMNSLPFLFTSLGYQTAFLYGGRAIFDNMGRYWSKIGFDQVLEQSDIAEVGFSTIWGVADEYLFTEALKRLDAMTGAGKPVFLSLLTVSNHRPYTYPEGRIGKDPKAKRRENAATYADWAFGDFVDRARAHAWFKDTVFIFVGDHGPRVYGAAQVPVPSYRVPLLYYAPAHIAPGRDATLGSSMDMAPTLLGLLGISYDSPFFGVDLRRVPVDGGRVAMEHNFSMALGDGRRVAMLLPGGGARGYEMTPGPAELVPRPAPDPDLLRRSIALYQTAHRMFYGRAYHRSP
ncbi:MAG: LTA synthase family protein [Pseudomonadota bacterium]